MDEFDDDFVLINETYLNDSILNGSFNATQNVSGTSASVINIMSYPLAQVIFYIQYVTIFLLGVFGNCLVCYVVFRNKHMQTVTNYFIANLALADILLCVLAVPFTPLYFFMGEWVFGRALCHLLSWSQGVSVYVSTLTLTSIAIDRFFVIIYPFRPRLSLKVCYLIIVCIWVFSLSATLPYALYIGQAKYGERYYCEEFWTSEAIRKVFSFFTTVMQFVIPFLVILFCYAKISIRMGERVKFKPGTKNSKKDEQERERKKRTNRMLIAMVSIFGISWLPFNVYHLVHDYYSPASEWAYTSLAFFITHVVAMSSTCYNTFLYAWLNENFRKEFQLVLPCFKQNRSRRRRRSGRGRSDRTCNGGSIEQTQQEILKDNASSVSPEVGRKKRLDSLQATQTLLLPHVHSPPTSVLTLPQEEVALTTFHSSSSEDLCRRTNGEANETL